MTVVLKLGGSVVTDKSSPETIDRENLAALADAVAGREDLVLVHGAGSFGHRRASAHGVTSTEGTRDAAAVRDVHESMGRLTREVLAALGERGVPAVPVRPFSAARRDRDGELSLATDQIATMLDEGFVPVLHGDVVVHAGKGATILSGDEIVVAVATAVDADRVGLCSTVPGVLDGDGRVVPRIEDYDEVADALGGSDETDVTGGMAAKVRELLALDAPAYVFDAGATREFLDGGEPGTRVG